MSPADAEDSGVVPAVAAQPGHPPVPPATGTPCSLPAGIQAFIWSHADVSRLGEEIPFGWDGASSWVTLGWGCSAPCRIGGTLTPWL